jgi:hypothetical protein
MRWLAALIRNAIGVVLGFFALPWCLGLLLDTIHLHQHWPRFPAATATGFALGLGFWFLRKPNALIHTLVHEACHALLCLLLFVRIRGIRATDGRGGEVEHDQADPLRSTLIAIAPYTVPLLVGPALLARMYWSHDWPGAILSGVVAFLFLTHLQGLVLNIRINFWGSDADLPKVGRFLALVLIAGCLLLLTTAVIAVLWAGGAIQQGR